MTEEELRLLLEEEFGWSYTAQTERGVSDEEIEETQDNIIKTLLQHLK